MIRKFLLALVVVAVSVPFGYHAHAAKFIYASQGDPRTLDPHAMNEQLTLSIQTQIYDTLVGRGKNLELVPSLATSWENTGGATWRFTLREGVKFHEGQDFTAEDVAFSIERGKPGSQFRAFLAHITDVRIVDDFTVDVTTAEVDPLLPGKLSTLNIMDRDWAIANDSETVSDIGADAEEIHATRHANGTGPYRLRLREPGIRTELARNDDWWGENEGNVTEATYLQITSAPTRVAALLSGEVDMIMDAPLQDLPRIQSSPDLKVLQGPEIRTLLIGMDQHRDQPLHAFDGAGNPLASNPFKDFRVRQAVAHAINVDVLIDRVLRGNGVPAGIVSIPGLNGYDAELDRRPAFDLDKARSLMNEAGWGDGFRIGFLCPNNRYVNDTEVCRAIAGQLAQIQHPGRGRFGAAERLLLPAARDRHLVLHHRPHRLGVRHVRPPAVEPDDARAAGRPGELRPLVERRLRRRGERAQERDRFGEAPGALSARHHPRPRRSRRPAPLSPGHQLGDEVQRRRDASLRQLRPPEMDHG